MTGPATYQQLDYMAEQLTQMETQMIDPREFGRLETEVAQIKLKQGQMDEKLDLVLTKLSEATGGWRTLMWMGGAAAAVGSVVTWVATHTFTIGPR